MKRAIFITVRMDSSRLPNKTMKKILGKPVLELMAFKLHIMNEAEILDHKHYYTGEEIREICRVCGLDVGNSYRKFWFGMNSIACAKK